jgi:hypothetical protein
MLASWVMASPLVVLHVYSSLIVPLVGASEAVKHTIATVRKHPKLLGSESLSFFPYL